ARRLPEGRRYGVVGGVGRALRALRHFRFDDESLRFLRDREVVDEAVADWLANYEFSGDIWGYPEGEIYFPGSPLVMVESTFGEAVVLETLLLSIYNHDSAIASAASRMTAIAGDRPIIEMGSRRTHELAAVAAAPGGGPAGFFPPPQPGGGRGGRGLGPRPSRFLPPPRPWGPAAVTECRHAARRRTPSPCCTRPSAKR